MYIYIYIYTYICCSCCLGLVSLSSRTQPEPQESSAHPLHPISHTEIIPTNIVCMCETPHGHENSRTPPAPPSRQAYRPGRPRHLGVAPGPRLKDAGWPGGAGSERLAAWSILVRYSCNYNVYTYMCIYIRGRERERERERERLNKKDITKHIFNKTNNVQLMTLKPVGSVRDGLGQPPLRTNRPIVKTLKTRNDSDRLVIKRPRKRGETTTYKYGSRAEA